MKKHKEVALKYNSIELIGDQGSLAYILTVTLDIDGASRAHSEGEEFIQFCSEKKLLDRDYLDGLKYVFNCLKIHIYLMESNFKQHCAPVCDCQSLPKFDELTPKTQAAVLALKLYFFKLLWNHWEDELLIVEKMIELDVGCFEWHLCKATTLRFKRQQELRGVFDGYDECAFEGEIIENGLAKALFPTHPICILDYCQLVAEMGKRLRETSKDWENGPLRCGNKVFASAEEMANFMRDECKQILDLYPTSIRVNYVIAEIFMRWLPTECRDMKWAKICLQRALTLQPTSYEGNYHLATYYTRMNNVDKFEEYCSLAVKCDIRKNAASAELVLCLLRNPVKNEAEIIRILDSRLRGSAIPMSHKLKGYWYLYAGIFLHLRTGHEIAATDLLEEAHEILQMPHMFEMVFKFCPGRYKWPPGHVTISKIRNTVKSAIREVVTIEITRRYLKLDEVLQKVEEEETRYTKRCKSDARDTARMTQ